MRIWNVPPHLLCKDHLLGEHCEMHMFAGTLKKGRDVKGWADKGQCITTLIKTRHDELAKEMTENRGYNHKSPMEENPADEEYGWLPTVEENLDELARRCEACTERQLSAGVHHTQREVKVAVG